MVLSSVIDIFVHVKTCHSKFHTYFFKMNLLIIISLFSIFQVTPGDIYTSGHEVKELVKFERNLIDSLDTYFRRQKNNGITFDSSITG